MSRWTGICVTLASCLVLVSQTQAYLVQEESPQQYLAQPAQEDDDSISLRRPQRPWEPPREGVGHLSEWSKAAKLDFLQDLTKNLAYEWIIVMGNEGGDTDSMASALAWSYHLSHLKVPVKAIALLQTDEDALDLRPENRLALHLARMTSGHRDLLTKDELPIKPFELAKRVKGIVLVDHNVPLAEWQGARVMSIIDHHHDAGQSPDAFPRIVSHSASCSSLVAREILDAEDRGDRRSDHDDTPVELFELLLRAIALDSAGLKERKSEQVDVDVAHELFKRSRWWPSKKKSFRKMMKKLGQGMKKAKTDLQHLTVRDLLRRDWKGDDFPTQSNHYPTLNVGFATVPYSMEEQINRTPEGTPQEWFAIERAFTAEKGADVSICLTNSRDESGNKVREVALVVAHGWGKRLSEEAAEHLFETLVDALVNSEELSLKEWSRPDGKELLPRRAVWIQDGSNVGRKIVRPIVERAVRNWQYRGH